MEEKVVFDLSGKFREAFDYFNEKLFDTRLPQVVITTQKHRGAAGFFLHDSYCDRAFKEDGKRDASRFTVHEIAIMPDVMYERTDREVLSTLVHEMCHLQQHEMGKPSRNGYHNREWANFMVEIGLQPSSRGKFDVRNPELTEKERKGAVEGNSTGQNMSHFIIPGGRFDRACAALLEGGFRLDLDQAPGLKLKAPKSKFKYTCPTCGLNAWAKRDLKIACGECGKILEMEKTDDDD